MGKQHDRLLQTYLPLVFAVTFAVAVAPLLLVLWLRGSGVIDSAWVGMVIGIAASFLASFGGAALWKTRSHSRDVLFSDLMLWGWVQRWRSERRMTRASTLLGLTSGRVPHGAGDGLSDTERLGALTSLIAGMEARDPYTYGHSRRVARHAAATARRMGLSRASVARIRAAGAIHDVGKVKTPTALLRKSGKLTPEEYAVIQRHPDDGADMAGPLVDPEIVAMVRHHHERLDGTGYPDRLRGDAIPLGARILAVADTFDAITSTRPYRIARRHKDAFDILSAEAGTRLDPDAVRAFCRCYSGRRSLAFWTMFVHARPRVTPLFGGGLGSAQAATVAAVVSAAAIGVVGGGAGLGVESSSAAAGGDGDVHAQKTASAEESAPSKDSPGRARSRTVATTSTGKPTPGPPAEKKAKDPEKADGERGQRERRTKTAARRERIEGKRAATRDPRHKSTTGATEGARGAPDAREQEADAPTRVEPTPAAAPVHAPAKPPTNTGGSADRPPASGGESDDERDKKPRREHPGDATGDTPRPKPTPTPKPKPKPPAAVAPPAPEPSSPPPPPVSSDDDDDDDEGEDEGEDEDRRHGGRPDLTSVTPSVAAEPRGAPRGTGGGRGRPRSPSGTATST